MLWTLLSSPKCTISPSLYDITNVSKFSGSIPLISKVGDSVTHMCNLKVHSELWGTNLTLPYLTNTPFFTLFCASFETAYHNNSLLLGQMCQSKQCRSSSGCSFRKTDQGQHCVLVHLYLLDTVLFYTIT